MKHMFALWFIGLWVVLLVGCSDVEKDRECGTPEGTPWIEVSKPPVANLPVEATENVSTEPGSMEVVQTAEPAATESIEPVESAPVETTHVSTESVASEPVTTEVPEESTKPSDVVAADALLSGVGNIISWSLNIQYRETYNGETMKTDFVFEQSPTMIHQIEYPELAVADGDYDKYYDIASSMLYSTGVGGWFSMYAPEFSFKHADLVNIDFTQLIESPVVSEDDDMYVVSGKCLSPIIDTLTWNIFDETASRTVKVMFDKSTHQLLGICFEETASEMGIVIEIAVSELNRTVVELPFNPDEVRFAG